MTAALFTYQVIDASSRVVPGAKVSFMQGFRKGPVWHDPEMRTPARNPHLTDAAGRVALYLKANEAYEITIDTPRGDRQQFTHVAGSDGETVTERVEVPVERIVEKVVTVESPELIRRVQELEAENARLKQPTPSEPPKEIHEFIREGEPHGEAQARLWKLYNELTTLLMMGLATDEQGRTHSRLHGALYWIGRSAVEVI